MLRNYERGYAVMTKELDAFSFESDSIERCKRYCFNGDVIVERIPYVNGFNVRVRWYKPWKWVYYDKWNSQLNIGRLHIQWGKEYAHKNGKIVYRSEIKKD